MIKPTYYLNQAKNIGKGRERCYSRHIGSVLVRDDTIISTGFNGPPRGIPKCDEWKGNWGSVNTKKETCPRRTLNFKSGEGLQYCGAAHSEQNAIYLAAKNGVSTKDAQLFCFCPPPCKLCTIAIIQSGISAIYCLKGEFYDELSRLFIERLNFPLYGYDEKKDMWYQWDQKWVKAFGENKYVCR